MNGTVTLRQIIEVTGRSQQGVSQRATREYWPYTEEAVRGGRRRRYHEAQLPADVRQALLRRAVAQVAVDLPAPTLPALPTPAEERERLAQMSEAQRAVMEARLHVLIVIDELGAGQRAKGIRTFLAAAKAGDLPAEVRQSLCRANARRGGSRLVDRATLLRWFHARDRSSLEVAPRTPPAGPLPAWLPPLLALYQRPQKPSVADCMREWPRAYPDLAAPPLRSAQRRIQRLPVEVRQYGRMGRAARRALQPFTRRTLDGLWPMDVVTVDGHMFKGYARHPLTGRKMRPELTTYLDIATRRAVGFSAWIAESQHAIWIALGDMVLDPACGVPAIHYSDNGAYRGDRHRSVMARIGTTLMFSEAYRAQARGVIERFNSSVWVPLARQQATYCGDDADPEYLKKQLAIANGDGSNLSAWSDFVADCRRALADYNARPHATLQGKSPDEAWALAVDAGWQPTPLTGDDLHDLLPSEQRQVRRGEITLPWGRYASEQLRTWHGLTVRVSFDPMDGAQVWVADDRGRLICTAERDANARPYVPQTMLAHAQAQRTQGRVARLERALDAVREEGATQIEYVPAPIDPQVRADVLAALAVAPPSQDFNPPADETDLRKVHARWLLVERRIKAGEPVSAQEAQGWEIYRHSDLFRSADEFFRLFGLEAEDVLGAPAAAETEDTE